MSATMNGTTKNYILSSGNILKFSKKAGQKPTEELLDSLQSTLTESEIVPLPDANATQINWMNNDLLVKLRENPRENIKIATKVFLNDCSEESLRAAIDNAFRILDTDFLDTLILAYHPRCGETNGGTTTTTTNGAGVEDVEVKEGVIEWGDGTEKSFEYLKRLWTVLETYSDAKKIKQLGVSDLNATTLRKLYEWSKVQPTITQINLNACCVVPPDLKEYCNEKEIQLLTHSDPQQIISKHQLVTLDLGQLDPHWTLRYQVHVKCRGVLISKGFIVGATLV